MRAADLERAAKIVNRVSEIDILLRNLNSNPQSGSVRMSTGGHVGCPDFALPGLVAHIRKALETERIMLQRRAAQISLQL